MTKTIIAGVAMSALLASQALAQASNYTGTSHSFGTGPAPAAGDANSGGDGLAQWYIYGTAASYCTLGQAGDTSSDNGNNVTIDTTSQGSGGRGFNGATSDGSVKINQLQGPNDQQNSWYATIRLPNSVCNTGYTVTANSANGGLKNAVTTADAAFTSNLDYNVKVGFTGNVGNGNASSLQGSDHPLATSAQAGAGTFLIEFDSISSTKYLVAGNYNDNVLIKLTANVGGAGSSPAPTGA